MVSLAVPVSIGGTELTAPQRIHSIDVKYHSLGELQAGS